MKIRKLIVSLIAILVVFGTVSFAAGYNISLDPVIEYTAGTGYVEVKLIADETVTSFVSSSAVRINFDSAVFELDSANTTTIAPSSVVMPQGVTAYAQWSSQDGISSMAGGTLATIRFNVKDGQEANVVGKEFYISNAVGTKSFDRTVTYTVEKNNKIAVTAAGGNQGGDDVAVNEGATANGITEYTFENSEEMRDKKVLMTSTAATVSETTRFYVSYQGAEPRVFGSDIWEKLAQGGGSVSVANVKFGLIVSEGLNASDFEFEVK